MKFMHLADLHIGKRVNGFLLLKDQQYILQQILDYVKEYQPEVLLISGDVYDKKMPTEEAVRLLDQFLTDLVETNTTVLMISGNHDSPDRLGFGSRIIETQEVYIQGPFNGELKKVTRSDGHGPVNFYLLPFVRPYMVRPYFEGDIDDINDAVQQILQQTDLHLQERNVLLSHQFITHSGVELLRSDSEQEPIGGLESINASLLFDFDYVALGHLHRPQSVAQSHIRYAGSPLKYSFSEHNHKKAVTLVELGEKGEVSIQQLPLTPLRDMRKIKGTLEEVCSKEYIEKGSPEDYMHITLTDDEELIDGMDLVREVYPNVMVLTFDNKRTRAAADFRAESLQTQEVDPLETFDTFYSMQNGEGLNNEQLHIVKKLFGKIGGQA